MGTRPSPRFGIALARYSQALTLAEQAGNDFLAAHAHNGLASAAREQGDLRRARGETEKALELWTKLGDEEQVAEARAALGKMGA